MGGTRGNRGCLRGEGWKERWGGGQIVDTSRGTCLRDNPLQVAQRLLRSSCLEEGESHTWTSLGWLPGGPSSPAGRSPEDVLHAVQE